MCTLIVRRLRFPRLRFIVDSSVMKSSRSFPVCPSLPDTSQTIRFYSTHNPWGEFSNFALFPIHLGGRTWPTSEHYFQAQKFSDRTYQEKIRHTKSPGEAAWLGRSRSKPLRRDWERVKDDIMYQAMMAKFIQHEYLRELLLSTGGAMLVEHTHNDDYWGDGGDGGDGSGKNRLGMTLMKVRETLRKKEESRHSPACD